MNIQEEITKAKFFLNKTGNYPFYGYLLFLLKTVETKSVPTMGVDGSEYLYINPNFLKDKTKEEIRGLLSHEVSHLALGHLWRRGTRNPFLWNVAADFVINAEISCYQNVKLPRGALIDHKYNGWATERVYDDLKKNVKTIKLFGIGKKFSQNNRGQSCRGSHGKWNKNGKKGDKKSHKDRAKRLERKWRRAVQQAANMCQKQKGNLPAGIRRLVEENQPKVNWKEVLLSYVVADNADYSYRRPDKRFLNGDFIMPDMIEGEKLEDIVLAVDCSGSIGPQELSKFATEVKSIMKSFDHVKAWICSFDTKVYEFKEISDGKDKIQYVGGGGTDTQPVFNEIKKRGIHPKVLLIFTDLYADFPSQKPDFDVIWLAPKKDRGVPPNWGRLIDYE